MDGSNGGTGGDLSVTFSATTEEDNQPIVIQTVGTQSGGDGGAVESGQGVGVGGTGGDDTLMATANADGNSPVSINVTAAGGNGGNESLGGASGGNGGSATIPYIMSSSFGGPVSVTMNLIGGNGGSSADDSPGVRGGNGASPGGPQDIDEDTNGAVQLIENVVGGNGGAAQSAVPGSGGGAGVQLHVTQQSTSGGRFDRRRVSHRGQRREHLRFGSTAQGAAS